MRPSSSKRPRRGKASVLDLATGNFIRSEKEEERACDRAIYNCGGDVVRFSQPRESMQTEGIPDRRYRVRRLVWWFEVKAEDGKLSSDQRAFLIGEMSCGQIATCGVESDLIRLLALINEGEDAFRNEAALTFARWEAKGVR